MGQLVKCLFLIILIPGAVFGQDYSRYNWSLMPVLNSSGSGISSYIDYSRLSGDNLTGFKVTLLTSYSEITSAQMLGLSEIQEIVIDCKNGFTQELKSVWFDKEMAEGKVTKIFGKTSPNKITSMLEYSSYRKLFKFICQ